jgi:2,4'-dihydroxyacetophenone dioxygenase
MHGAADLKIIKTGMGALVAPPDMLADIMRPDAFGEADPRQWVPLGDDNFSLPLCLNVSEGYWVHLLRATKPGVINRHRHSAPVHLMTIKGHWHYPEKDWVAGPGTYVFEPPGDIHTLCVPEGGAEMVFMANVRGALLYVDEKGALAGYDDVFTRIEACRRHYSAIGLGPDYVKRFIR